MSTDCHPKSDVGVKRILNPENTCHSDISWEL